MSEVSWYNSKIAGRVTWSGTWTGIIGSLTLPYFLRDAVKPDDDLIAAGIALTTYFGGMGAYYLAEKTIGALSRKTTIPTQELSDKV